MRFPVQNHTLHGTDFNRLLDGDEFIDGKRLGAFDHMNGQLAQRADARQQNGIADALFFQFLGMLS